jgi:hypothetical protein
MIVRFPHFNRESDSAGKVSRKSANQKKKYAELFILTEKVIFGEKLAEFRLTKIIKGRFLYFQQKKVILGEKLAEHRLTKKNNRRISTFQSRK